MKAIHLQDVTRSPIQVTLNKGKQLLDPRAGIIQSIIPNWLEQGDPLIHAFGAVSNQAGPLELDPQTNRAGGASLNREIALASTIGEAVERYCSAYYESEELVFATYNDVAENAVHPSNFGLYSERQYQTPGFPFKPFTPDSLVSWTWGYSLQRKQPTLVPASLTYLPFRANPNGEEVNIAMTTSTGLACGNTIEEAILSGIGEVVERDAITCFWMNRLELPHVEVDEDSTIYDLFKEKLDMPGLRYYLCEATTDLGIPTFFTLMTGNSNFGLMINSGSQANPSTEHAALKSLVEAAHGRPYVRHIIQQSGEWKPSVDFSTVRSFQDHAAFYTRSPEHLHALDFITAPRETRRLSDIENISTGSVSGDIECYLSKLAEKGFDVIVVDLTPCDIEEVGFKVVRVIVPGLQLLHGDHQSPFLGCARLYNVPEVLGYSDRPRKEEEMNPYPHPLP